jgi:hypothetical protein
MIHIDSVKYHLCLGEDLNGPFTWSDGFSMMGDTVLFYDRDGECVLELVRQIDDEPMTSQEDTLTRASEYYFSNDAERCLATEEQRDELTTARSVLAQFLCDGLTEINRRK